MKFARCCSLILAVLIAVSQAACISGGVSSKAEKLIEAKDYQAAIDVYQTVVDTKPGTSDAREAQLAMGELYIKKMNKPDDGVKVYQEVISSAPESEEAANAHYELGMHHFRSKAYQSAQEQFDVIVNKFSGMELSNKAQLMLAKSYEEAKEVLKEAIKRDRNVIDAVILSGQKHYSDGKVLENDEDKRAAYERAIAIYNSVLGINPNKDAEIYYKLGLAYQQMREREMERESFERAVAAKPDYMEALTWLPDVYKRMKNRPRAVIFQDIVEEKGELYVNNMALADLCYTYENYRQAKAKYSTARRNAERGGKIDINTDSVERLRHLPGVGTSLGEAIIAGRPYKEIEDLLNVDGIDERRLDSIRPKAVVKKSEAIGEKRKRDKRIVHAMIRTAMAAYKLGQEDKAQETMDALAKEYADHPLVPYGSGEIALLKGDGDTAVAAFKEAIEKAPNSDFAPVALGEYYLSQGFDDEALALWETFIKENRYNRNVNQRLKKLRAKSEGASSSEKSE